MKIQRRLAVVAFIAVACGATAAHAQTLALAYHQGDVYKYGLHVSAKAQIGGAAATALDFDMSAQESVSVLSVDSSGNATVSVATSNLTVKSTIGTITTTTTGLPGESITMTIAPDGRVLTIDGQPLAGTELASLGGSAGSFISAVLPDNAVKPGDTWSKTYDIANPTGTGGVHITANSKYLRDETVKGVSTAVVETKSDATLNLSVDLGKMLGGTGAFPTMPGGTVLPTTPANTTPEAGPQTITITGSESSDTTTWVDPSGHRIVKTHQSAKGTAQMTFQMAVGSTAPMITPTNIDASETFDLTPV